MRRSSTFNFQLLTFNRHLALQARFGPRFTDISLDMTTLTIDAHRERMMRLLEGGNSYQFVMMAGAYLEVCPDDHYVRLMAVREYLKLGLVLPARELVEPEPPDSSGAAIVNLPAELTTIRGQLAAMHGGAIAWSRFQAQFEANLAALSDRGVDVATIQDGWAERQSCYQVFRDGHGVDQVRMGDGEGRWRWIPYLGDHRTVADSQPLPDDVGGNMPGPYLFEGIDLGWYFRRVYDATRDTFLGYSCALFVVEPDPALLAVVLHLHDWCDILADARLFLFVGDSCTDQLRRAWDEDLDLPWPQKSFSLSAFRPGCVPSASEVVSAAAGERERVFTESFKELEARYGPRDLRYWADRFDEALSGRGEPLRILAAVSIHTTFLQYSMRDARKAFEDLGHQCVVLTENTDYQITGPMTYHNAIRDFDPDLFFILDHVRPEFGNTIPANLPILTWDQDCLPHVFTKSNLDRIAGHDFIAGCSKPRFVAYGYDPGQYLNATVPTSPEQFGGDPLTGDERDRYVCDVSYVSHASQTPREFHEQERARYKDAGLVELLDVMYRMMPAMLAKHRVAYGALFAELMPEASSRCGVEIRDQELRTHLREWYLWRLGDRMFRHEALEWVARWARQTGRSFRIYGNGWDRHPTLAPFAVGPAQNGRELLCIHRASRINLQLMPAGFLHQRAMDGLAGGGFFMARATPADTTGRTLRPLVTRIRELRITTTPQLIESTDEVLQGLLGSFVGEWLRRVDEYKDDVLSYISIWADVEHPDEAFPRLTEILFDSEQEFVIKAERFLADEATRTAAAGEMRQVVVDRFSYRQAMDRFLRTMGGYLREACVMLSAAKHLGPEREWRDSSLRSE